MEQQANCGQRKWIPQTFGFDRSQRPSKMLQLGSS
jgi:hypothetical protein